MKKNLLFIGLSMLSLSIVAQPTLTSTNTNPVIGETNGTIDYNWISAGSAGANQTWNFGAITTSTTGFNMTYTVSALSATVAPLYPNGNLALKSTYGGNVYKTSATILQLYGTYDGGSANSSVIMQNPQDVVRYPFTYGNSFTDTYSGTQGPTGAQQVSKGTVTVTADGYGTLTLPQGTFSNVLRVYTHVVGKDSSSAANQFPLVKDVYDWFLPNNHYPILENSTTNYSGSVFNQLTRLQNIAVGIHEIASIVKSFNLYPNPNTGKVLNLDLNLTQNSKYQITITDNLGREVLKTSSDEVFEGYNFKTIDISGLENGMYTVGISTEHGKTISRKLTIQN